MAPYTPPVPIRWADMAKMPAGYRRTRLCPTLVRPTLQRDGYLLRVALVGGRLEPHQLDGLARAARLSSNGIVELTNRANLQLRGLPESAVSAAIKSCQAVGLGDAAASLVTISPFANAAAHGLRGALLEALSGMDVAELSPRFAVHVDDEDGLTADRPADLVIRLVPHGFDVRVPPLGNTRCGSDAEVARMARILAERCAQRGSDARVTDLARRHGTAELAHVLGAVDTWISVVQTAWARPLQVGVQPMPDGVWLALAAARIGRVPASMLVEIADLLRKHQLDAVPLTPWRTLAFRCISAEHGAAVLVDASRIGLLTDPQDPALGVVACIGSAGCWQTELDTLTEAQRLIAHRPPEVMPGQILHISGCDKLCATRAPVALTLLGRRDQTGFDRIRGSAG
jgi:precorrin-3B synthase